MKRKRGTRSWSYNSLMLFREDLEEIFRLFNPTGAEGGIKLSDSKAEYDSLDDMKIHCGPRIEEITVESRQPGIVLNLRARPKSLSLYTLANTDEADVAFFKTNEFLQPKRRPLNTFVTQGLLSILMLPLFLGLTYLTSVIKPIAGSPWLQLVAIVPVLFLAILVLSQLDKRTVLFLSLASRQEYRPFTARKKDELIMLAIGTALGTLITLILSHLHK